MTRSAVLRAHPRLLVVLSLAAASPLAASAGEPVPYRLVVAVDWGERSGPESFRQALADEIASALRQRRCFRSVEVGEVEPAAADLLLRVVVDGYDEEVEYPHRIAVRDDMPQETSANPVARIEARFDAAVLTDGRTVRRRRFLQRGTWKPLLHEDPRPEALRNLIVNAVRTVRKLACKGSPAKWAEQLERARTASPR